MKKIRELAKQKSVKVGPQFKLDRIFREPYCVQGVNSTSVRIHPINNPDAEVICISLQCLSCYTGPHLDLVKSWLGHGNVGKHQKLQRKVAPVSKEHSQQSNKPIAEIKRSVLVTGLDEWLRNPVATVCSTASQLLREGKLYQMQGGHVTEEKFRMR